MRLFKKILCFLLFFPFLSCSAPQPQTISKTYNSSFEEFQEHITGEGYRYIIISADWCFSCHKLQKYLRKDLSLHNVMFIDIDEKWARFFAEENNVFAVPYLIIMNESEVIEEIFGVKKIVLRLRRDLNSKI